MTLPQINLYLKEISKTSNYKVAEMAGAFRVAQQDGTSFKKFISLMTGED